MVKYDSFALDKLVLSVMDDSTLPNGSNDHAAPVGIWEANAIIKQWMRRFARTNSSQKIVLSYSGRNFTSEGAAQFAAFTSLNLISSRIAGVEMSGILGVQSSNDDAVAAQAILIHSLKQGSSYRAVKLDNVEDAHVEFLLPLLAKESMTLFHLADSRLSAYGGLDKLETLLIQNIPGTTHCPCYNLQHIGFSDIEFDDPNDAAEIVGTILSQSTSLTSFQYSNCRAGQNGSEALAGALSILILQNAQVRESIQHIDLHGCLMTHSFGLLCDPLVRCANLKTINLCNCQLLPSQIKKIKHKLGPKKRLGPPTLNLDTVEVAVALVNEDDAEDDQFEFDASQALF